MRIGDFNRRCAIQKQASGVDEAGQPLTQWVDVSSSVPCNVEMKSGRAQIAAGTDASIVMASVRIRWRTDITATMRLVLNGAIFKINAVLPDYQGRRYVDLVCEEIT